MTVYSRPATKAVPIGKIAMAFAGYEGAKQAYDHAKTFWHDRLAYSVTINERDRVYDDVHDWLLELLPSERQRSLSISTRFRGGPYADGEESERPFRLIFNDTRERRINVDGETVSVRLHRPESAGKDDSRTIEESKIVFTCRTQAGQKAVIDHIQSIHEDRKDVRPPLLRMVNAWGSWRERADLPPRSLESVAIADEQKRRIVADLERFLAAEDRYDQIGTPWHRGYMFHGEPGTGKTSLAKALSTRFSMDIWYISLSDLKAESGLMQLLAEVGPRSILLLEDIDSVAATRERATNKQGEISTSSLLNALDGVATPHGLVTIMTTNHFDALDPALTRAGRMDMIEEIAMPTWTEVASLFEHFYSEPWEDRWTEKLLSYGNTPPSMARVSEAFKQHLDSPTRAMAALMLVARTREESAAGLADPVEHSLSQSR